MENDEDIFIREFELESRDATLTFLQRKVGDVSCVVWDAAIVLARYLDVTNKNMDKWMQGKSVLELGAGLGCAGLVAACLGARVILTDLEEALPMLKKNVNTNEEQWRTLGGSAEVQRLKWGNNVDVDCDPDIILLADCIYYEESLEPLLDTLDILCRKEGTYAILSQEERNTPKQMIVWNTFFKQLNERFKVEEIPPDQQHPIYSSTDIYLMKISKF